VRQIGLRNAGAAIANRDGEAVLGHRRLHVDRRAVYYKYLEGGEYCLPTCGGILEKPLGEFTVFGSRARAEAVGLQPCSDCRPDLHPLPA